MTYAEERAAVNREANRIMDWLSREHHHDVMVSGGTDGDVECFFVGAAPFTDERGSVYDALVETDDGGRWAIHGSRLAPFTRIEWEPCEQCGRPVPVEWSHANAPALCGAHR